MKLTTFCRFLAPLLVAIAAYSAIATTSAEGPCAAALNPADYRQGKHMTYDPSIVAMSRRPEPGSLEDRHPGIAKEIIRIMYGELTYFQWNHLSPMQPGDARELYGKLDNIHSSVRGIPKIFSLSSEDAARFETIAAAITQLQLDGKKYLNAFSPTSEHLARIESFNMQIQSTLLELIVSTLLDGKKFLFHVHVTDHYLGFKPNGRRILHWGHTNNREVDLIVERHDGTDLWVEVKNNAIPWTLDEFNAWCKEHNCRPEGDIENVAKDFANRRIKYFGEGAIDQAKRQIDARKYTKQQDRVRILMVSKYESPPEVQNELKTLGIETWPLYIDVKAFRDELFQFLAPAKEKK